MCVPFTVRAKGRRLTVLDLVLYYEMPLSSACAQNSRNFEKRVPSFLLVAACSATLGCKSPTEEVLVVPSQWWDSGCPIVITAFCSGPHPYGAFKLSTTCSNEPLTRYPLSEPCSSLTNDPVTSFQGLPRKVPWKHILKKLKSWRANMEYKDWIWPTATHFISTFIMPCFSNTADEVK